VSTTAPALPTDEAAAGPVPAAGVALKLEHVSKTFRIPHRKYSTLKERALHPLSSRTYDELHAVNDVSVEIAEGEFFGIVGRNGSGKSTLLKCLAGIYEVDAGKIEMRGRLAPFIELGVGFNMDLAARDNVIINAVMLGMSRKEAQERFDDIIAFAELEEFLDLKLKNYSSGMQVRLAFSVAIQADAEIVLVDEVLAVGDAAFQQKCFEQFQKLKDAGKTIIFVTHDMGAVERLCDRALLIERGNVVDIGEPHAIARKYNELNFGRILHADAESNRYGDRSAAEITAAWFEGDGFERVTALHQSAFCHVCVEVQFNEDIEDPIFGWSLRNEARQTIMATSTSYDHPHTGTFKAGETVVVKIGFSMRLAASRYTLSPSVARAGAGEAVLDVREDLTSLIVHATRSTGGVVDLEQVFNLERVS
jgi:ABC-type polysaccharide/polyol phosphate transport system ATPase subunit